MREAWLAAVQRLAGTSCADEHLQVEKREEAVGRQAEEARGALQELGLQVGTGEAGRACGDGCDTASVMRGRLLFVYTHVYIHIHIYIYVWLTCPLGVCRCPQVASMAEELAQREEALAVRPWVRFS